MRRWFIALLTLLVAAQLSWAGPALCCVGELAGEPAQHSGLFSGEQSHAVPASQAHPVCETGHCQRHHAGCATPPADSSAPAVRQPLAHEPADAARPESHIPAGLERPNWPRA